MVDTRLISLPQAKQTVEISILVIFSLFLRICGILCKNEEKRLNCSIIDLKHKQLIYFIWIEIL